MLGLLHGAWLYDFAAGRRPWSANHGQHGVVTVVSRDRLEEATKALHRGESGCISSYAFESSMEGIHHQSISVMLFDRSLESTTLMICQHRAPTVAFSEVRMEGIMQGPRKCRSIH
jgi:hypothetical protein